MVCVCVCVCVNGAGVGVLEMIICNGGDVMKNGPFMIHGVA